MAKQYRQNASYRDILDGEEGEKPHAPNGSSGNTRLPFGLCERYGISLPRNATPRMAWEALKQGTGLTPEQVYKDLREKEQAKRESAKRVYDDAYDSRNDLSEQVKRMRSFSDNEKQLLSYAKQAKIEYRPVGRNTVPINHDEIVAKIAGGDETKGSCVSVALAYIGNVIGFDVMDFRGGESQKFFSNRRNVKDILSFDGLDGYSIEGYNDFTMASEVLSNVAQKAEYLFVAGKHVAVVRRGNTGFEYLELQSPTKNGYRPLTRTELKERFGCQKSYTVYGNKVKNSCHLVRLESFSNSKAFIEVLGYISTTPQNQKKGGRGSVK